LLLQATRGSSSASSTFLECIRLGTAPSVLVLTERDAVLVVGGAVAWEIYQHGPTIVIVPAFPGIPDEATILVDSVGDVYLEDDAFV
jgi:predicted aconitase with swiveling domain